MPATISAPHRSNSTWVIPSLPSAGGADDVPPALRGHPRYRVTGRLATGGMGELFLARHLAMDRTVVLKLIHPEFVSDSAMVERFRREVRAAASLSHPNIVAAFDAEHAEGLHVLCMEHVPGVDLARLVERDGPLPVQAACRLMRQAALGLQHAHEHGMVHRDIKPHNLMVTPAGQLKILDFGIAKFQAEEALVHERRRLRPGLTGLGDLLGTPDYLAPEQAADAHAADIRADLYSLGCTFHHALTGRPPFPGAEPIDAVGRHRDELPPSLAELRPEVPAELAAAIAKLLSKRPAERFQTPAELAKALEPILRGLQRSAATLCERSGEPAAAEADGSLPSFDDLALPAVVAPPARRRTVRRAAALALGPLAMLAGGAAYRTALPAAPTPVNALAPALALAPPAATATPFAGAKPGAEFANGYGMRFRWCPAGTFRMGKAKLETTLSQGFWLGETEVTQGAFQVLTGLTPWKGKYPAPDWRGVKEGAAFPASCATWNEAAAFCATLTQRERQAGRLPADWQYRLPGDAEWEYACRAGAATTFNFGDDHTMLRHYAWYDHSRGREHFAHEVGLKKPNAWNLHDMHGNVWEWCADRYALTPVGGRDPAGPATGDSRVTRGGGWFGPGLYCTSVERGQNEPAQFRSTNLGFRAACAPVATRQRQ